MSDWHPGEFGHLDPSGRNNSQPERCRPIELPAVQHGGPDDSFCYFPHCCNRPCVLR